MIATANRKYQAQRRPKKGRLPKKKKEKDSTTPTKKKGRFCLRFFYITI